MNFHRYFLFILPFVVSPALSQSILVDSLTVKLKGAEGEQRADILNRLTYELLTQDNVRAMKYCDQSLVLSNTLDYDKGAGIAYTYKGVFEYLSGEFSNGRSNLHLGLQHSVKAHDKTNVGYTFLQLGNSYLNQSQFDSALVFYNQAYTILKDSANPITLSKLYKNLSSLYRIKSQYELQKKYLLRALHIRELLKDQALIANALIALTSVAVQENDFERASSIFAEVEKILQANPDDLPNLNDWRHQKALYLLRERKFDEALVLFDSARNYYVRKSLLLNLVTLQTDLGENFYKRGEYELALKSLYEGLRVAELKHYIVEIIDIQLLLGWVNFHLGELNQSLLLANSALKDAERIELPGRVAGAFTLKGVTLTQQKNYADAKKCLDEVLIIRQNLKDQSRISEALMNLGFLEESKKNYTVAKGLYTKSLELAEISRYDFGKAWSLLGLGTIDYKMKNYNHAAQMIYQAEKFSKEISANEILIGVYELHRDLLAAENNYKESLLYSTMANALKDSLRRNDLSRRFINLQKIEEIERRDRDIKVLTKDKQLAENKISLQGLKLNQQYFLIIASGIGLTLLGVLAYVYAHYFFRIKRLNYAVNEKKIRIQHQADELTKINSKLRDQNELIEKQKLQLQVANENLEDEVNQRTDELTKQNQQLEQFAFMTSHNLRAPVARLLGLTQLFDHHDLSNPLNQQLIEKVRITALHFDVTMRDLASILEVKKGVIGIFSVINLEECLGKAKAALSDELSLIQFSLSAQFEEATVYGVEPYLISIFYNLLSNSTKFKKENMLDITIASRKEDDQVILEYIDDGIGFDMKEAGENLFKPYKRFHNHKAGKGLGLYMIKLQVEAMGGAIRITSSPNMGFSCIISLKALVSDQLEIESNQRRLGVM